MCVLVAYALYHFSDIIFNIKHFTTTDTLKFVSLIIILVKAYHLLYFYMISHHVSVRYIVEISIIAPAVELIFVPNGRSMEVNILYAIFGITNLIIYMIFYHKLHQIDNDWLKDDDELSDGL